MKLDAESYLKTGSNELRILEYRCGALSFGVNILKVNKIVNNLDGLLRVPQAHAAVCGVFRDMDRLIPVVDLAAYLGVPLPEEKHQKVIVTEFFGCLTGFLVSRVDWIHHFKWEDVIDTEAVFAELDHRNVIGIVKPTEERMVQLLDYETILMDLSPQLRHRDLQHVTSDADFNGKRVLIAEDSPAVRSMLVTEMSELGFDVVETRDGVEAWRAYSEGKFDLVISDVEMPQMDGLALTLKIRQSEHSDTPVIVYSSIGDVGMKARARFLKADAHITKLNLDKLVRTADALMKGKKLDDSDAIETTTVTSPSEVLTTIPLD